MAITNYQRGRAAEWRCIEELQDEGFTCIRSAASKGPIDIAAWNDVEYRLIQIKSVARKQALKAEQEKLQKLEVPMNTTVELWIWLKRHGWYRKVMIRDGSFL